MSDSADHISKFPWATAYEDDPPDNLTPEQVILWGLFKTVINPIKANDRNRINACKELGIRAWGRPPVVEYVNKSLTFNELDLRRLNDGQAHIFQQLMLVAAGEAEFADPEIASARQLAPIEIEDDDNDPSSPANH